MLLTVVNTLLRFQTYSRANTLSESLYDTATYWERMRAHPKLWEFNPRLLLFNVLSWRATFYLPVGNTQQECLSCIRKPFLVSEALTPCKTPWDRSTSLMWYWKACLTVTITPKLYEPKGPTLGLNQQATQDEWFVPIPNAPSYGRLISAWRWLNRVLTPVWFEVSIFSR